MTRENLNAPWLMFEAGALAKQLDKSRACAICFGVTPADLTGPLSTLQATKFAKEDMKDLLRTINKASGEKALSDAVLTNVFEKWWPDLENSVKTVLESATTDDVEEPVRPQEEILDEILMLVRKQTRNYSSISPKLRTYAVEQMFDTIRHLVDRMEMRNDIREYAPHLIEITRCIRELAIGKKAIAYNCSSILDRLVQKQKADYSDDIPF